MNREILFRGKDIKGNWYEGLLAHNIAKDEWYISNKAGISTAYQVRPETIGQFTGLSDKNSTKIFEGDIVRIGRYFSNFYTPDDYVCRYDNNTASFAFYYIIPKDIADVNKYAILGDGTTLSDMGRGYAIENVVGNIWDNPELIGSTEKKISELNPLQD